ncbi:mucin-2 [Kitasatospora sp. NPDC094028]
MPWFKIDDKAHSHPKWLKAGNAAIGLFVRAGSYSAQHLTEGIVPAAVAQLYGTTPQAAKLVKVGLWHQAPHDCPRCPQPGAGDYVIHDFFEGGRNTTKAQDEANKKAAAERAAKSRAARNANRIADENASNRPRFVDENETNRDRKDPHFQDCAAGQEGLSHRTPADGAALAHNQANTHTPVPPTEVQLASRDGAQLLPTIGPQPRIPAACRPLVEALTNAQMVVGWDEHTNWLIIDALIQRCGVPMLVDHARGQWQGAKRRPQNANYFIPGWRSLPDAPHADTPATAPAGPLTRNQQRRDLLAEAAARFAAGGTQ